MEFFFYVGGQSPIQKQYNPKVCSDMVFNSRSSPFHFLLVICPCWCLGKWATGCFYDMLDFVVLPLSTGDAAITSKQLHRVLRGAPIQSGAGKHRWNQHHQDLTNTKQMWWFFVQGIPKLCCETNSKQMWRFFVQGIPKLCCETNTKQMWWFFSTSNVINLL